MKSFRYKTIIGEEKPESFNSVPWRHWKLKGGGSDEDREFLTRLSLHKSLREAGYLSGGLPPEGLKATVYTFDPREDTTRPNGEPLSIRSCTFEILPDPEDLAKLN